MILSKSIRGDRMFKLKDLVLWSFAWIVLTMAGSAAAASPEALVDSKATVTEAFQQFRLLKNYHLFLTSNTDMTVQGKTMHIFTQGECDVELKPLKMKNDISLEATVDGKVIRQKTLQFMEERDKELILYTQVEGNWYKQSLPYTDPLAEYDNYFKAIKAVELVQETPAERSFVVTIDGNYVQQDIERTLAAGGILEAKIPAELFQDLGDFTYTVTIDRRTGVIARFDMDLTGFMAVIGKNILASGMVPDTQKAQLAEMFRSMKITTGVAVTNPNRVMRIVIPSEAKKAAWRQITGEELPQT